MAASRNTHSNSITILSEKRSAVDNYMQKLRSIDLQKDREGFRKNIGRVGQAIGYEISKELAYHSQSVQTPLGIHDQPILVDQIVVITILRAGLPMHNGILEVFPDAENGFISAYRKHTGNTFQIEVEYVACPDLNGKVLILNDPMLATGQSFLNAWAALKDYGKPSKVHLAAVIGSREGLDYIVQNAPGDFRLWVGDVDDELNENKYIVPGLGDAGDLAFGSKTQN